MSTEPNKVIYSMVGVSKFYDKKPVLKDIYLSYFYGAKIGVIGLNGSGKSSLLRILAGVDKEFNGETVISPGFTVGYLEQEPLIDDSRTVREVVEEAVQETVDLLKEFEEINAKFGEEMSDDEMDALLERQGEVQEKLDASGRLGSRFASGDGDGRAALSAAGHAGEGLVRRRTTARCACAGCCCKSPTSFCSTNRRTISMRNQSRGSNITCRVIAGTIIAVTHDRYFLDNVAGWILELDRGAGHSLERKLHVLAGTETGTSAPRRKIRKRTTEDAAARARMDSHVAESASRERQSAHQLLRSICCDRSRRSGAKIWRFTFRPGRVSATS